MRLQYQILFNYTLFCLKVTFLFDITHKTTKRGFQFVPGEDLQDIFREMEFNLVACRYAQAALLRAQKKGETTVDISKPEEEEGEEEKS